MPPAELSHQVCECTVRAIFDGLRPRRARAPARRLDTVRDDSGLRVKQLHQPRHIGIVGFHREKDARRR
eukprot:scaffold18742_cov106-Isochrysis_galbana.AAC.5